MSFGSVSSIIGLRYGGRTRSVRPFLPIDIHPLDFSPHPQTVVLVECIVNSFAQFFCIVVYCIVLNCFSACAFVVYVCASWNKQACMSGECSSCLSERPGGGLASSSSSRALLPIEKTGLFALSFSCRSCCSSSSSLSTLASRLFYIGMGRG